MILSVIMRQEGTESCEDFPTELVQFIWQHLCEYYQDIRQTFFYVRCAQRRWQASIWVNILQLLHITMNSLSFSFQRISHNYVVGHGWSHQSVTTRNGYGNFPVHNAASAFLIASFVRRFFELISGYTLQQIRLFFGKFLNSYIGLH